jgi:acyl-CoA thioester hydrolase
MKFIEGRIRFPVYYEDTDFTGYVYHANYLKFFERAREELVGLDYVKELYIKGFHYVVARMNLSFHEPAKHGDLLEIETKLELSPSPVTNVTQIAFLIDRAGKKKPIKLVTAQIKLVGINNEGEATRPPADVAAYFELLAENNPPTDV